VKLSVNALFGGLFLITFIAGCQSPARQSALDNDQTDITNNTVNATSNAANSVVVDNSLTNNPSSDIAAANSTTPSQALTSAPGESENRVKLPRITEPTQIAQLQIKRLSEISGMAWSRRQNNVVWMINDSGNAAAIYALDANGKSLGHWAVDARNRDWEDLASVWINGDAYLLIADVGDNLTNQREQVIYIVSEPQIDSDQNTPLQPVNALRFRYSEGSHNVEAVASDGQYIYLLTKEALRQGNAVASQLFQLPLSLVARNELAVATKVATLPLPKSSLESSLIASVANIDIRQPTAMDFDQSNRFAYVLSYRTVKRYEKLPGQNWSDAFVKNGTTIYTHNLQQAESLAVAANGTVWISSEKRPSPLIALPAPAQQ